MNSSASPTIRRSAFAFSFSMDRIGAGLGTCIGDCAKTGIDPNDAFASLKLAVTDLQGDPGRLLDEVNAIGLFGGEKLVWVKGAANEKPLVDALQVLADNPPETSFLIIEAGDLKKGTGLRKIAEPSRSIAAIPAMRMMRDR